jgi:hypothetical protein
MNARPDPKAVPGSTRIAQQQKACSVTQGCTHLVNWMQQQVDVCLDVLVVRDSMAGWLAALS